MRNRFLPACGPEQNSSIKLIWLTFYCTPRPRADIWGVSRLTLRILAVNVLSLATLVGGSLYLVTYQEKLVATEINALQREASIFATALGEGAVFRSPAGHYSVSGNLARQMVSRLVDKTNIHTQLLNPQARVITEQKQEPPPPEQDPLDTSMSRKKFFGTLDRMVAYFSSLLENILFQHQDLPGISDALAFTPNTPDTAAALSGKSSSTAWRLENGHIAFSAAVPITRSGVILGVVHLWRDSSRIDETMRSVRWDFLRVFLGALSITILLSLYLASAIAHPIRRLAIAAENIRKGHSDAGGLPDFSRRHDEIGDLSLALRAMTATLESRLNSMEKFAADVSHEIKNPLTSLRSAVETLARVKTPEQQQKLLSIISHDVLRIDRLITDISKASRLDVELSRTEAVAIDMRTLLGNLADAHATTAAGQEASPHIQLDLPPQEVPLMVTGNHDRLMQVLENILANALSFTPPNSQIHMEARHKDAHLLEIRIRDEGPGIPPHKLETVFERFYSERPSNEEYGYHSGLGLSISQQIVKAHGGQLLADNHIDNQGNIRGAVFTLLLPLRNSA